MLGRVLLQMGLCDEQAVVEALGVQAGMGASTSTGCRCRTRCWAGVGHRQFYNIVPIRFDDGVLTVAMADPLNLGSSTT